MSWVPWREAWQNALYGPDGFFVAARPVQHFRTAVTASGLFAEAVLRVVRDEGFDTVVDVGACASDPSRRQIGVFLSILDVHINRSPLAAVVERIRYTPGSFFAAYRKEAATQNERNEIELLDGEFRVEVET